MKKIFFNSSMPRSGSTLIQNILAQNPEIYTTPTSGLIELLHYARQAYSKTQEFKAQDEVFMKNAFLRFCESGMQGYFKPLTNRNFVVDKSRIWIGEIEWLSQILNARPKIICTVRDLRDVVTSFEKKFRTNPDKHPYFENQAELSATTTVKRVEYYLSHPPIGLFLDKMFDAIHKRETKNILFVRYEDLCQKPQEVMDEVYKFLQLPSYTHDFKKIEQFTSEDDKIYGIFGDHQIREELKLTKSTHQEVLGKELGNYIFEKYKWYFEFFKYNK